MKISAIPQMLLPNTLYERLNSSSIAKRLARGSLWGLLGSAVTRILTLIAMILVARILGKVAFGELGIIKTTIGVAGLMAGLGLGSTATRFVAQYINTDSDRAGRIIALVTSSSIYMILFFAGLLVLASGYIADKILVAPHLQNPLIYGSLLMSVTAFRGIQNGILSGMEKFEIIARLNILEGLVSLVAMVGLANIMGINGVLLGAVISITAVWLIGYFQLTTLLKERAINVCFRGCFSDWRILIDYSIPNLMANLVATPVLWYCMTMVAHSKDGYAGLGLYNAAYQFYGPMMFIPMILMSVSIPVLVQEWESGRRKQYRKIMLWLCILFLSISIPPALIASLMSSWIMALYGPEFSDGWVILVCILAAVPMHGISKIASSALLAMNKAWYVLILNSVWGLSLIVLAYMEIPNNGALGLAIAFLSAHAVTMLLKVFIVINSSFRENDLAFVKYPNT